MGGLAYFVEYLQATGLFESFVRECPLSYESNNAPAKLDILGVVVLSVLRGHTRYAHMSALCGSELDSQLLGMSKIPSEDSVRGALSRLLQTEENEEATKGQRLVPLNAIVQVNFGGKQVAPQTF